MCHDVNSWWEEQPVFWPWYAIRLSHMEEIEARRKSWAKHFLWCWSTYALAEQQLMCQLISFLQLFTDIFFEAYWPKALSVFHLFHGLNVHNLGKNFYGTYFNFSCLHFCILYSSCRNIFIAHLCVHLSCIHAWYSSVTISFFAQL